MRGNIGAGGRAPDMEAVGARKASQTMTAQAPAATTRCTDCDCDRTDGEGGCVVDATALAHYSADVLDASILSELCGSEVVRWYERMSGDAEERRRKLFRTSYRAVESEVIGLGVKW